MLKSFGQDANGELYVWPNQRPRLMAPENHLRIGTIAPATAVSRKIRRPRTFDINLLTPGQPLNPRRRIANDYQVVLTFVSVKRSAGLP